MYKLKKIVGSSGFSVRFVGVISHYKKIGCSINKLQQTVCLVALFSSLVAYDINSLPLWLHAGGSGLGLCDGSNLET